MSTNTTTSNTRTNRSVLTYLSVTSVVTLSITFGIASLISPSTHALVSGASGIGALTVVFGGTLAGVVLTALGGYGVYSIIESKGGTPELTNQRDKLVGTGVVAGAVGSVLIASGVVVGVISLPISFSAWGGNTFMNLTSVGIIAIPVAILFSWVRTIGDTPRADPIGEDYTPDMNPVKNGMAVTQDRNNNRNSPNKSTEDENTTTETGDGSETESLENTDPDEETPTGEKEDSDDVRVGELPDDLDFPWVRGTDVSMEDIGGMEDLKDEIEKEIIRPVTTDCEQMEKFDIPVPNILFHGPPGTGKTYTAEAIATELQVPFVSLSGSDVTSKWINESSQKVSTLFKEAELLAEQEGAAVVFVDELDSVLPSRDGDSHEENRKVVNEFLSHLQNTGERNILFIGATNRKDDLDNAAVRSGRIDREIFVGKPDTDARKEILRVQLGDRPHDLTDDELAHIAKELEGVVAADIESIVLDAARICLYHREGEQIKYEDFRRTLEER